MLNCEIGLFLAYQVFSEKTRLPKAAIARKEWIPFGDSLTSGDNSNRTVKSQEDIFIEDPKVSMQQLFALHSHAIHVVAR